MTSGTAKYNLPLFLVHLDPVKIHDQFHEIEKFKKARFLRTLSLGRMLLWGFEPQSRA
jgi:hypothetical protein